MSIYAIGDVQGCYESLRALLVEIRFDRGRDHLWFVGDLVNRGPQSLEVLRFVRDLGERSVCVLGNHDLHLLAVACGAAKLKKHDTLDKILCAPDRDDLLRWLRSLPLMHHDEELGYTMIHAGLLPSWDLTVARHLAREVETALQGDNYVDFFKHMYGNLPDHWSDGLRGYDRLRVIVNAYTRLRYCDLEGGMDLRPTGPPGTQPPDLVPWFQVPARDSRDLRIIFGHWSALGRWRGNGVICLDSGCVWGQTLTAARLDVEPVQFSSLDCPQHVNPRDV